MNNISPAVASALGAICGAIVGAIASIIVAVIQSKSQHNAMLQTLKEQNALVTYRMDQLEQKVDKHNHLVDRMYAVEQEQTLQGEKLKVANHRLDDLENKVVKTA